MVVERRKLRFGSEKVTKRWVFCFLMLLTAVKSIGWQVDRFARGKYYLHFMAGVNTSVSGMPGVLALHDDAYMNVWRGMARFSLFSFWHIL